MTFRDAMNSCGDSLLVERSAPPSGGGSIPTSPLQLQKRDWNVAGVDQDVAERLVIEEHYARGASNTATYLHGLYPADWLWYEHCVGVAWWIPPTKSAAQWWAGEAWEGVLALSRLAIRPDTPRNAASFLLSKSVRMIDRSKWHTLISYADKWRGHTGAIYLAAGWEYCGETKPSDVWQIKGRMTARKAGGKTRTHAEMKALGAELIGRFSKTRFCLRSAAAMHSDGGHA